MSRSRIVPQFLGAPGARIFVLLRAPQSSARGCVLIVPPFAEEMNKSRRMITLVARELAQQGIAVLLPDLYGTGDSDGEFEEADWQRWKSDVCAAAAWAEAQGLRVDRLLGIRLGCLLAAEVARESLPGIRATAFWQPVVDGNRFLEQFLRLRVAASMMELDRKESTAQLRARFAAGEAVEVAGYSLSALLADAIDRLRLDAQLGTHLGALEWLEVVRSTETPPPAPVVKAVERARDNGVPVALHTFAGEPYWSTVEIAVNPALVRQSVEFLAAGHAA